MLRKLAPFVVGIFFTIVGITHFTSADFFVSIVPPYLPAPLALLVVVYPANIHMAMNPGEFPDIPPAALYARLPIQFVFAWVVWWATRPRERASAARAVD